MTAICKSGKSPDQRTASARSLHDHIVARTSRLADAMLRMSSRHIRERWNLRNTDLRLLNILDASTNRAPTPTGQKKCSCKASTHKPSSPCWINWKPTRRP
jgi:hypothetical protein